MTTKQRNKQYKKTLESFIKSRKGGLAGYYGLCGYLRDSGFTSAYDKFKDCPEIDLFTVFKSESHPFGDGFRATLDPIRETILCFAIAMTDGKK